MPVYAAEIWPLLLIACLPAIMGIVCFVRFDKERLGLPLILTSALLVRLVMISSDPFLHDWDERFHALVAKHLMDDPFVPMLRLNPVMPYDLTAWCCNHIWLHKQPLFLWQMAASMKVFGVSEFAMRLPSALMGMLQALFVFQIARFWTRDKSVALLAGLLSAFAFYQIELSTGRYPVDHNDVAFTFYATAGIWGFTQYLRSGYLLKWAVFTGIVIGCAVLVKWLTAFFVFGGWGLYLLLVPNLRVSGTHYRNLAVAVIAACLVFVPWQIYIMQTFPEESAASYAYNWKHIFHALEPHGGSWTFHISRIDRLYGAVCIPFLLLGAFFILRTRQISQQLSWVMMAMAVAVYVFFSFFVATKLPAYVYPVHALFTTMIAFGLVALMRFLLLRVTTQSVKSLLTIIFMVMAAVYSLNPPKLLEHRLKSNISRNQEIHNAQIFKTIPLETYASRIILNCKAYEDIEIMFYTECNAYGWWPEEHVLDSLQQAGHQFAAFTSHTDQWLPEYITQDSSIILIEYALQ